MAAWHTLQHVLLATVIAIVIYILWMDGREKTEEQTNVCSDRDEPATRSPPQVGKRKSTEELMREIEVEAEDELRKAVQADSVTISLSPPSDSQPPPTLPNISNSKEQSRKECKKKKTEQPSKDTKEE